MDNVVKLPSPALGFEAILSAIKLKETKAPSSERILAVFKVFDDVIPHTSIFSKVLKIIRDEVYDAVYSQRYTSSQEVETSYKTATNVVADRGEETKTFIERIPYFTLVQQVFAQRNEVADELKDELEILERRLRDKEKQNTGAQSVISSQRQQVCMLEETVESKNLMVEERDSKIESLQETNSDLEDKARNEKRRLENIIRKLEDKLSQEEKEVVYLNQYKEGYESIHQAFIISPDENKFPGLHSKKKKAVLATKKNQLLSSLEAAKKLEQQILMVQNQIIDEFDSYLETHKVELSSKHFTDKEAESHFSEDHRELDRIDLELQEVQDHFKTTIGSLANELDMIRQHKDSLEKELEDLMKSQAPKPPSRDVRAGFRPTSKDSSVSSAYARKQSVLSVSSISAEPIESFDLLSSQQDPFVPQETVLSKYSVMLYTSTNSKQTFHELKDGKFCSSCGEKTVLCPHKVSDEMIITLPHQCTHIKLSRPKIRLPVELKKKSKESTKFESVAGTTNESTSKPVKRIQSRQSVASIGSSNQFFHEDSVTPGTVETTATGTIPIQNPPDSKPAILGGIQEYQGNWLSVNSFMRIWEDYKDRTTLTREIPRPMKLDHTLSIIAQYYADVLWCDENADEDTELVSIIDGLYDFMFDRYLTQDVTYLVMHDFITSLIENALVNKHIQIFSHILVGNLDGAVFRYLLLVADLIDRVDWRYVEDFKGFIANIYPFLNEDDIDQMHLAYTSFSENKITKDLVYEFFLYIILKYREPQFHEIERKLLQRPAKESGVLDQREFFEAMEALSPLSSEKLRTQLFKESALHYSENDKVSVMRLSQIGSYILLLQVAPLLRQKIAENVEDARLHHQIQATLSKADIETSKQADIMSMTKLRNLARNVARREQHRSLRQIEGNLRFNIEEESSSGNKMLVDLLQSNGQLDDLLVGGMD
ncbi:uncharacterized protein LOC117105765 isoform X2 [Anneissia japonica]|uniref:uncharacterized protein LOC117105765 isoform X2 n=1 Tax=Anneissia japonica TaxID=1529436 RepID=UPI00142570A2|nr:uncharacterized protein LOC117105765 isoform X2 [Anneissia japonica]